MSKTDELFEKLDYIKIQDKDICKYVYDKGGLLLTIRFNLKYKTITISMYDRDEQRKYSPEITIQELQAINEKVKELGWLDNSLIRTLEYADNPITP